MAIIKEIKARKILSSKDYPTIETTVVLTNNIKGVASVPSGTSVGKYEAVEIKDIDKAIKNVESKIAAQLAGYDVGKQVEIDKIMIKLDGTKNKKNLGSNSILSVSIAVAKAASQNLNLPLFKYLNNLTQKKQLKFKIPLPCFNLINGGKHAYNNLSFQEFLIIPSPSMPFKDQLNLSSIVYDSIKKLLESLNIKSQIGDEGGISPPIKSDKDALSFLIQAIKSTKFQLSHDVFLGIDCASSNLYKNGKYKIAGKNPMSSNDLFAYYKDLSSDFPLLYLEDPFSEDDWEGWNNLTIRIPEVPLIVGDDLTATNPLRLKKAFDKKAITGIIIKPNQIGTISEAIEVVKIAKQKGLKVIVSHRSGETNDDFIADFAVGVGADYVKFGPLVQKERIAKYNRLLQIESQLKQ